MSKTFTTDEMMDRFNKLSAPKKVEVLQAALSEMQSYNGQSESTVICKGMGYRQIQLNGGDWVRDD